MIDVASNRQTRKYSPRTQMARVLWALCLPLFALSPRPLWGWRRFLLRMFGAEVGREVHVYPTARVLMPWNLVIGDHSSIGDRAYLYNIGKLTIGKQATVSYRAHICGGTHDYTLQSFALVKTPITIGDGAWVCTDAFVGPGVDVGARAIVGARAVTMKDVPAGAIVGGNPAKLIRMRDDG